MVKTLKELHNLVEEFRGNFMVFSMKDSKVKLFYYSKSLPSIMGRTEEEVIQTEDRSEHIFEDDRAKILNLVYKALTEPEEEEKNLLFRLNHKTKGFTWVHFTIYRYGVVEGNTIAICQLTDVTKESGLSNALMEASNRYICVIEKSTKKFLYGNSGFFNLINMTQADAIGKHCYEILCHTMEMKNNDNCLCYSSINADPPVISYNPITDTYLSMYGKEAVWGEYDAYVFFLTDVTAQKKQEEALKDAQKRFEIALKNSDIMVWEYDMVNNLCINSEKAGKDYNIPRVIENYPESLFETGHVPPETIEQIKDVQRRLRNGETGFSMERRTVDKYGKSQWQKVEYTLEKDNNGKPVRALVCGLDISEKKELEKKYEEQMEYRNKLAGKAMFSVRLDLDDDSIIDFTCNDDRLLSITDISKTAKDMLNNFFTTSVFDEDSGLSRAMLSSASLREAFLQGNTQITTVYRCSLLNLYLKLELNMYRNPLKDHIEVFYIINDVTETVLAEIAFKKIISRDYDFMISMDAETGEMKFLATADDTGLPKVKNDEAKFYDSVITEFAGEYKSFFKSEAEFQATIERVKLNNIKKVLEKLPVFEFNAKAKGVNGDIQTFRLSYSYTDASKKRIVFTRANITNVVNEEENKRQELEKALIHAKEADQARAEFLSRMSHDMRTPMNGIIGMTRLTQDMKDIPQEARGNLEAIADSSAYLLQLINDTLDMNKIEIGRLVLDIGPTDIQEVVKTVIASSAPVASQKHIDLIIDNQEDDKQIVMADSVRMTQILMNILSNALKFTPEGGNIRIRCGREKLDNGVVYDRFIIEDTGCGMSDEYIRHIYEPFSQEHTRITSGQEGTGLGMSIVKNLVDMMGGTIDIESEIGSGTRVTVRLHFSIASEADVNTEKDDTVIKDFSLLKDKVILLCEDHPLNAVIAERLLQKEGVHVELAENGCIGVDMFQKSKINHYDAVLMDIRMPEMNGLEATRCIRQLDRTDAKTVPILAMTANAYKEDVEASFDAGMNAHIAKPIKPETLYSELVKAMMNSKDHSIH